eukprot:g2117.t1
MNGYDISSTFLVFVGSSFANAGGAGGGGIFVPLLILLTQFTPHGAIPLSKAMIFGGALTFVSITFRRRHPEVDRPLIDYDIALMFEPMVLCGTTVGVLLNRVFPSWMLLVDMVRRVSSVSKVVRSSVRISIITPFSCFEYVIRKLEERTVGYWLLTFSVFPVCLAVTFWVGRDLRRLHQRKVELGYKYLPGMVQWNSKNSIVYPLCCFFAGCAAGLLGIGGGLVLGPMLLEMNFAILGQLDMEYAAWFGTFTSLGAVIGVFAVQYAVQKLGRPSVIVLSLATVILLSAI